MGEAVKSPCWRGGIKSPVERGVRQPDPSWKDGKSPPVEAFLWEMRTREPGAGGGGRRSPFRDLPMGDAFPPELPAAPALPVAPRRAAQAGGGPQHAAQSGPGGAPQCGRGGSEGVGGGGGAGGGEERPSSAAMVKAWPGRAGGGGAGGGMAGWAQGCAVRFYRAGNGSGGGVGWDGMGRAGTAPTAPPDGRPGCALCALVLEGRSPQSCEFSPILWLWNPGYPSASKAKQSSSRWTSVYVAALLHF